MAYPPQTPYRAVATVSVVGPGRLGRAIAAALRAAGLTVNGPTGRGEVVAPADVVLLCVPDGQIARAAASLGAFAGVVGHTSGATSLGEMNVDFGLHPLQTFMGNEGAEAFRGIGCAVSGRSPAAVEVAHSLATRLGARPFMIDDEHRAGYHTAASIASNYTVTLLAMAEKVAATAGLAGPDTRALLAPLVRSTVENWAAHGPAAALTGPVARQDWETVDRQRAAVASHTPDLLQIFDLLTATTSNLAKEGAASA